jgi:hypothetical protein
MNQSFFNDYDKVFDPYVLTEIDTSASFLKPSKNQLYLTKIKNCTISSGVERFIDVEDVGGSNPSSCTT